MRIRWTATDLLGFATNTYATFLISKSPIRLPSFAPNRESYLENVEPLVLNHFAIVFQQLHAEFQILPAFNICHHHAVIGSIQQNLAEKLYTLALGNIGTRLDECIEAGKEEIKVGSKVGGHKALVTGENVLCHRYSL